MACHDSRLTRAAPEYQKWQGKCSRAIFKIILIAWFGYSKDTLDFIYKPCTDWWSTWIKFIWIQTIFSRRGLRIKGPFQIVLSLLGTTPRIKFGFIQRKELGDGDDPLLFGSLCRLILCLLVKKMCQFD